MMTPFLPRPAAFNHARRIVRYFVPQVLWGLQSFCGRVAAVCVALALANWPSRATAQTKSEVLEQLDLFQAKAELKINLDVDSAALAFETAVVLGDTHYEELGLLLTTLKTLKTAIGLVGIGSEVMDIRHDPSLARKTAHSALKLVDMADNWRTLVAQANQIGTQIYAIEAKAETRASVDQSVGALLAKLEQTRRSKGETKIAAFDYMFRGPTDSANPLKVRVVTSTVERARTAPFASIEAANKAIGTAIANARAAVSAGTFTASQLGEMRDFVRERRSDVVRGMAGPHVARYVARLRDNDGHKDVASAIQLGRIATASQQHLVAIEQFNQSLDAMIQTTSGAIVQETVGDLIDVGGNAATSAFEKRWFLKLNIESKVAGASRSFPLMIDAATLGLDKTFAALLSDGESVDLDPMISNASVKSQLIEIPARMFWSLPEETAATMVLVQDVAEFIKSFGSGSLVPPAEPLTRASIAVQAARDGSSVTVQQNGKSEVVTLPHTLSGNKGANVTLRAPADSTFVRWVVDGVPITTRDITIAYGTAAVVALVTDPAVPNAPPIGATGWKIVGPSSLGAGATAQFGLEYANAGGRITVTTGVTWDVSNSGFASITGDGQLSVKAALRERTSLKVFAWHAAAPDRVELSVTLEPSSGGRFFKIEVLDTFGASFHVDPEPIIVDGEPLYLEGTQVAVTLQPGNWTLENWGLPEFTTNPLRFSVRENWRIMPNLVSTASTTNPRRFVIEKPAGLGRIYITSQRFTHVMEKADTRFTSDLLAHKDEVRVRVETDATEEFISWINSSQGAEAKFTMVDHLSLVARMRSRLPGADLSRSAQIMCYKETLQTAWHASSDAWNKLVLEAGPEFSVNFHHARPGGTDSNQFGMLKIPQHQLLTYPGSPKSVQLRLKSLSRGRVKLMRPSGTLTLPTGSSTIVSKLPEAIDIGAPEIDCSKNSTVAFDLTALFADWRKSGVSPGAYLKSTLSGWQATFASSTCDAPENRPVLELAWDEEAPSPAAPIVVGHSPTSNIAPAGTKVTLFASPASSDGVTFQWSKNGTVISNANTDSIVVEVLNDAEYEVKLTNDHGSTKLGFRVSVPDTNAPSIQPGASTWVTDRFGQVTVRGTATDDKGVARVHVSSFTSVVKNSEGTTTWSAEISATPGVHFVKVEALDDANNLTSAMIRVINPTGDSVAPTLTANATRQDAHRIVVNWRAFDAFGLSRLTVHSGGSLLSAISNPDAEASIAVAPSASAESLVVEITDFSDRTTSVTIPLSVAAKSPEVLWQNPHDIVYGMELRAAVSGDVANMPGTFDHSPSGQSVVSAGTYEVTSRFAPADPGYNPVSTTRRIKVTKAVLTVRADDKERRSNESNPPLTMTFIGFVNGDSIADLDVKPTASTKAIGAVQPGEYAIVVEGGEDGNYTFVREAGRLKVTSIQQQTPVFTNPEITTFTESKHGSFKFTAAGISSPTFAAEMLPAWLSLNPVTGELTGTAPVGSPPSIVFIMKAANGALVATQQFTLKVISAPEYDQLPEIISSSPRRQVVGVNERLVLSVNARGARKVQWTRNGVPIAGAISSELELTMTAPGMTWYRAVVSNEKGSVTSPVMFVNAAVRAGRIVGWGSNSHGQTSVPAGLREIVMIAAGSYSSAALRSDGTVMAWGDPAVIKVPYGLRDVVKIAAGSSCFLALRSDGTVVAFGYDFPTIHVPGGLADVVDVVAGGNYAVAVKSDGSVVAWGHPSDPVLDVPPSANNIVAISGGFHHVLALQRDGGIIAWGARFDGLTQLPPNLGAVIQVAAGTFSAVRQADGHVITWGRNVSGIEGNGAFGFSEIAAGFHILARHSDGTLLGWGQNLDGQTRIPPTVINAAAIAAGSAHSLALLDDAAPILTGFTNGLKPGSEFRLSNLSTAAGGGRWLRNGVSLMQVGAVLVLGNPSPADAGIYSIDTADIRGVIVGFASANKVSGDGREVGADIRSPNGNIYDQVLLTGSAATITADRGQATRISFLDVTNDIVQVEFSGAGSLTVSMDAPRSAVPLNYVQPGINYAQGHPSITIIGANETTNLTVYTVGRATSSNAALFRADVSYDGMADVAFIAVSSTNGRFGGLRVGNVNFYATRGLTGVFAPRVKFEGPLTVGDITSFDDAVPVLITGGAIVRVTGGDLEQPTHAPLRVRGISQLLFTDGADSHGKKLPARFNAAYLDIDGVDGSPLLTKGAN